VREARPVHPDEDVRVAGDSQLHQEGDVPERQPGSRTSIVFAGFSHILTDGFPGL